LPPPASAQPPRPVPAAEEPQVGKTVFAEKPADVVATLTIAEPAIVPFQAEIRKWPFRIGRATDNDGVLPVESTSGVSGHQCFITYIDGQWYVQDDKSKFGTTVNGQAIPKGQPFKLADGIVLGLGPLVRIRFRVGSVSKPGTR
jgi:pSer/pThr/pTyr-binding forkhead associated (FHA) protein